MFEFGFPELVLAHEGYLGLLLGCFYKVLDSPFEQDMITLSVGIFNLWSKGPMTIGIFFPFPGELPIVPSTLPLLGTLGGTMFFLLSLF